MSDAAVRAQDVEEAVAASLAALRSAAGKDWSVPARPTTWSCRFTLEHVAEDLTIYGLQLAAGATEAYLPIETKIEDTADPAEAVEGLSAVCQVFQTLLRVAPEGATGWHPYGVADAGDTAAMGVIELMVHTWDICQGLGVEWAAPQEPSRRVLDRVFLDVDRADPALSGVDSWRTLLWATGRTELPDVSRRDSWRWFN
jgi:hypothetical protein